MIKFTRPELDALIEALLLIEIRIDTEKRSWFYYEELLPVLKDKLEIERQKELKKEWDKD